MNKTNKIILIFYIFLASSFVLYVFTYDVSFIHPRSEEVIRLDESLLEVITPQKITEFETSRLVDVPNNIIFDVMANVENFPNILPENIVRVTILNKINNEIIAEEELFEAGIKIKLLVKHTIKPYSEHIIEIIDGDAEGTKITQYFESSGSQTKLTTNVDLNVKGATSLIAFLPESNLVHAINTVISRFVEYSKYSVYEITVDSIYQEILNREADKEGLSYFSPLLRDGQITEQDIRTILLDSEEKTIEQKTIEQLNEETINFINDLYEKILLREADPEGLVHFGNLFERGMTSDKIVTMFVESDEAKKISLIHPVRSKIVNVYVLIFDRQPDISEVDHYFKMYANGFVLFPDWIGNILFWGSTTQTIPGVTMISDDEQHNAIRFLYNEGIIFPVERPLNEELVEYKN